MPWKWRWRVQRKPVSPTRCSARSGWAAGQRASSPDNKYSTTASRWMFVLFGNLGLLVRGRCIISCFGFRNLPSHVLSFRLVAKCSSVHWPRKKAIRQTFRKTLWPPHKLLTLLDTVIVIHCTLASSLASTSLPALHEVLLGFECRWTRLGIPLATFDFGAA